MVGNQSLFGAPRETHPLGSSGRRMDAENDGEAESAAMGGAGGGGPPPGKRAREGDAITTNSAPAASVPVSEYEYEFEATTCTPEPLLRTFETLGSMLDEMTLNICEDGITVRYEDSTRAAMIQMCLKSERFERFSCKRPINLSVFISSFCDFIGGAKGRDTFLTFGIVQDDPKHQIKIEIVDQKKGAHEDHDLPTFEPDNDDTALAFDINYNEMNRVCMDSSDLREIIKKICGSKGDTVSISVTADRITFSASGEAGRKAETRRPSATLQIKHVEDIEAHFPIRFMKSFVKAATVNSKVFLQIGTNHPLLMCYRIWMFGELWFALSPIANAHGM